MPRLKRVWLIVVFLFVKVEVQELDKQNFTSEWLSTDTVFPPMATRTNNHVIYVSFPSKSTMKLESSDPMSKSCEVPASVIRDNEVESVTPMATEKLGNGYVIVSILEFKNNTNKLWLYAIDPVKCSYTVKQFILYTSLSAATKNDMKLVPYYESFDIFMNNAYHCGTNNVCSLRFLHDLRLSDENSKLTAFGAKLWSIKTVNEYGSSDGYVYVVVENETKGTEIHRFDSASNSAKTIQLETSGSTIDFFSRDESSLDQCPSKIHVDSQTDTETVHNWSYEDHPLKAYVTINLKYGNAINVDIRSNDADVMSGFLVNMQHLSRSSTSGARDRFQKLTCDNVLSLHTSKSDEEGLCIFIVCENMVSTKCTSLEDNSRI